jgi:hypothetical protein
VGVAATAGVWMLVLSPLFVAGHLKAHRGLVPEVSPQADPPH